MCDTIVALGNATADGSVLFAKNSDREPNEAQELLYIPRATHEPDSTVQCTYIQVPQVAATNAVLLSKPFWIWGAEMGANEHGVVIGNEAVFTRIPYGKKPGLIGMDFLRLALERADSARAALDVIVALLAEHGQSGNCGHTHKLFYHNSFLIADTEDAWVLETAGEHWAAEQVRDIRSISNAITIGNQFDLASEDLVANAIRRGWCTGPEDFDFGRCYSDLIYTRFADGRARQCRSMSLLGERKGSLTPADMMGYLRDHGSEADERWAPVKGITGATICMHAGFGPVRGSQTTGSMVSQLKQDQTTHWLTGTSTPCTGIFKPIWMDSGMPDLGPQPGGTYDSHSLWWRHEVLHRETLRDYVTRLPRYIEERDALERRFVEDVAIYQGMPAEKRLQFSQACFDDAGQAELRWIEDIRDVGIANRMPVYHAVAWRGFNRRGGL